LYCVTSAFENKYTVGIIFPQWPTSSRQKCSVWTSFSNAQRSGKKNVLEQGKAFFSLAIVTRAALQGIDVFFHITSTPSTLKKGKGKEQLWRRELFSPRSQRGGK
jgi:hypothetical protein